MPVSSGKNKNKSLFERIKFSFSSGKEIHVWNTNRRVRNFRRNRTFIQVPFFRSCPTKILKEKRHRVRSSYRVFSPSSSSSFFLFSNWSVVPSLYFVVCTRTIFILRSRSIYFFLFRFFFLFFFLEKILRYQRGFQISLKIIVFFFFFLGSFNSALYRAIFLRNNKVRGDKSARILHLVNRDATHVRRHVWQFRKWNFQLISGQQANRDSTDL